MKTIYVISLLISSITIVAQNANWGTGLPVSVVINGNNMDLSVFDPNLNRNKTTSIYLGSNPIVLNVDGVVVGYGSNNNIEFAIYDIEQQSWKKNDAYIGDNGIIQTANGVVLGYGSNKNIEFAIYDFSEHSWKKNDAYVGDNAVIQTVDGVVLGYGSNKNIEFAIYDFSERSWKKNDAYVGDNAVIQTADGVVLGYGSNKNIEFATYDLALNTWKKSDAYVGDNATIQTADGVVVGYGDNNSIEFAIYDFQQNTWKKSDVFVGSNGAFVLSSATINYTGSSSGIKGYDISNSTWGSNPTGSACSLVLNEFNNSDWVFMECMSMGVSSYTYSAGDGHQITRRRGWKRYIIPTQYNVGLNVSNGVTNSSCNGSINLATNIVDIANHIKLDIFPNPTSQKLIIESSKPLFGNITAINSIGQNVLSVVTAGQKRFEITLPHNGIYMVTVESEEVEYTKRIIRY